jgi:hypothetical protein
VWGPAASRGLPIVSELPIREAEDILADVVFLNARIETIVAPAGPADISSMIPLSRPEADSAEISVG